MSHRTFLLSRVARGAALAGLVACGTAWAAGAATDPASAQERYRQEVAACNSGQSQQDRATCLREAGAALGEARKGQLADDVAASGYNSNATARCEVFVGEELSACRARATGAAPTEGATITRGSVNEGGIIRESIQVYEVPAGTPGSQPAR